METLALIAKLWPLVGAIVFAIAGAAIALHQIKSHTVKLNELELSMREIADVDKVVRGRLYTNDGMTIFMPRAACEQCRAECHAQMVSKFSSIEKLFNSRFDTIEALLKTRGRS